MNNSWVIANCYPTTIIPPFPYSENQHKFKIAKFGALYWKIRYFYKKTKNAVRFRKIWLIIAEKCLCYINKNNFAILLKSREFKFGNSFNIVLKWITETAISSAIYWHHCTFYFFREVGIEVVSSLLQFQSVNFKTVITFFKSQRIPIKIS